MVRPLVREPFDFIHQHGHLDQFDILERWIPVNVRVGDNDSVMGILVFQECDDADVVLVHDTIEQILCLFRSLHSDLVELYKILVN